MLRTRMLVLTSTIAFLGVSTTGCATKGFVRSEIDDLRSDMTTEHGQLRTDIDAVDGDISSATEASVRAEQQAQEARELALGHVEFREANRYRVYFDFDSASLDEADRSTLNEVIAEVRSHPNYRVDVYGFADPRGSESYNYTLGATRAAAVQRYLGSELPGHLGRYHSVSFGEMIPSAELGTIGTENQRRQVLVSLVEVIPLSGRDTASRDANTDTGARTLGSGK